MFLDLSQMRGTRDRIDRVYQPSAFESKDDTYVVVEPVVLGFDIVKSKDRFRLIGTLATTLELVCSRCVEPFRLPLTLSFDLMYLPERENVGEGEIEVEEDDLSTAYFHDHVIDLGGLMREQVYLALPMKPLCSETCRGLCPTCGANLNAGACGCAPQPADPRLEALRALAGRGGQDTTQ